MTLTTNIFALKSKQLFLSAPILGEAHSFIHYKITKLLKFTHSIIFTNRLTDYFRLIAGHFLIGGYKIFIATTKSAPDVIIHGHSLFHPIVGQGKSKFYWSIHHTDPEAKSYVTKTVNLINSRAWPFIDVGNAKSYFDDCNDASAAVAKRPSATFDQETTQITNAPGQKLIGEDVYFNVWRHRKGAQT